MLIVLFFRLVGGVSVGTKLWFASKVPGVRFSSPPLMIYDSIIVQLRESFSGADTTLMRYPSDHEFVFYDQSKRLIKPNYQIVCLLWKPFRGVRFEIVDADIWRLDEDKRKDIIIPSCPNSGISSGLLERLITIELTWVANLSDPDSIDKIIASAAGGLVRSVPVTTKVRQSINAA